MGAKFEGTFFFSIDGERWELEPGQVVWLGTFKGQFHNPGGFMDGATWVCAGITENDDGKSQASDGYLIATDSKGDKAWATWTGRAEITAGEISGKAIWRGGTGEYAGINGPLTYKGEVNPTGQGSAKVDGDY
jgi:hypothetical protein